MKKNIVKRILSFIVMCMVLVSTVSFMSVKYQKIELESAALKTYLSVNKDNIIEAVK